MLFQQESPTKVAYIWKQGRVRGVLPLIYAGLLLAVGGWRHSRGHVLRGYKVANRREAAAEGMILDGHIMAWGRVE